MLKYGMYAKAVELLCFKQELARLEEIYHDMDMKKCNSWRIRVIWI